jgi:hypothetical protein
MDLEQKPNPLFFAMLEYAKLKEEQLKRIEFRDRMVEINLAAIGVIGSWALTHDSPPHSLLLIPWVCIVLGWAYLFNDDKVSALGKYFRREMADRIGQNLGVPPEQVFQWEVSHRLDSDRSLRKILQFLVDQTTFILSGFGAIFAFVYLAPAQSTPVCIAIWLEGVLLGMLSFFFWYFSDFGKGR